MPRDARLLLEDMRDSILRIRDYTNGFKPNSLDDPRTLDAVIRNLEVLGEAAKGVDEPTRTQMKSIEWRKVAGFRDVLAHQYFGVDNSVIADVVSSKLPGMLSELNQCLEK